MAVQIIFEDQQSPTPHVRCDGCSIAIPADDFIYLPALGNQRLLSARCPGCNQWTTMSFRLWRRRMGMSVPSQP